MTAALPAGESAVATVERIGFTATEVAKAVGLHPDTIRDRIASKDIAAVKIGGRYIVSAAEVRRLFGTVPAIVA
jgi:excisionase family DNA binding protein